MLRTLVCQGFVGLFVKLRVVQLRQVRCWELVANQVWSQAKVFVFIISFSYFLINANKTFLHGDKLINWTQWNAVKGFKLDLEHSSLELSFLYTHNL